MWRTPLRCARAKTPAPNVGNAKGSSWHPSPILREIALVAAQCSREADARDGHRIPDAQMRASPSPLVRVPTGCAGNKSFQSPGRQGAGLDDARQSNRGSSVKVAHSPKRGLGDGIW